MSPYRPCRDALNGRLGEWVAQVRAASGLSHDAFAMELGIHRNTLVRYERGNGLPAAIFVRVQRMAKRYRAQTEQMA